MKRLFALLLCLFLVFLPVVAMAAPVDYSPIEGIAFELPDTVGGALAVVLGLMFLNAILAAALAQSERRFDWRTLPEFLTVDVLWIAILFGVLALLAQFIGEWFFGFYFAASGIVALVFVAKVKWKLQALIDRIRQ